MNWLLIAAGLTAAALGLVIVYATAPPRRSTAAGPAIGPVLLSVGAVVASLGLFVH